MNYTPAGYEDDSDEEDFYFDSSGFGGAAHDTYQGASNWPANNINKDATQEQLTTKEQSQAKSVATKEDDFLLGLTSASSSFQKTLDGNVTSGLAVASGWTSLMCACAKADLDRVQTLLNDGHDANESKERFTPLMVVASATTCPEDRVILCAHALLDGGAIVDTVDRHLMTALMHAALHGQTGLCKLLIDKDANVNRQDSRGWTGLMYACQNGTPQTINLLLAHDADRSISSYDGQRASDISASHGHTYIAGKLEANVEQINVKEAEDLWDETRTGVGYIKYDSLDTFVSGLGYGNLLHLFKDRNVSFHDFLKMSDKDLCEIGVLDPVARKKIVDSIVDVHTSDWNVSNLTEDNFKKMNTFELAATMAKVGKYVNCLASSVSFVRTNLEKHPQDLQLDNAKQKKMFHSQCQEATCALVSLQKEMKKLQGRLKQVIQAEDIEDVDLISGLPLKDRNHMITGWRVSVTLAVTAATCATLAIYYKPTKLSAMFSIFDTAN